jgi:alpha-methylacyl-CoA racemase
MAGPLEGVRVVEFESIGPGPHAGMQLSDLGAEVLRVLRPKAVEEEIVGRFTLRGRTSVQADLKDRTDLAAVLGLLDRADVLIEGFRPGVMERLGLGPDTVLARNPRLIFARMTGWGQDGPMADRAGHDINYISLTGALNAIGESTHPVPPLNLLGDYGGGAMFLMTGILAALFERERSGKGQVLDVAMLDGAATLIQPILEMRSSGAWNDQRANNIVDGAAPFYRTYVCQDGKFIALGAIEPQFYAQLLQLLALDPETLPHQDDRQRWPELAHRIGQVVLTKTRDQWDAIFGGTDACVTPVLSFAEAPHHTHVSARRSLVEGAAGATSTPAPRFSRSTTYWTVEPTGSVATLPDALAEWTKR